MSLNVPGVTPMSPEVFDEPAKPWLWLLFLLILLAITVIYVMVRLLRPDDDGGGFDDTN